MNDKLELREQQLHVKHEQGWLKTLTDIMPEDIIGYARWLGETQSDIRWRLGDFVNKIYARVNKGAVYTKLDICVWVAHISHVDISPLTIYKVYSRVAEFFPEIVRGAYLQLRFSHFEYAMKQDDPENALESAVEYTNRYNSLPSVAQLDRFINHQAPVLADPEPPSSKERSVPDEETPSVSPDPGEILDEEDIIGRIAGHLRKVKELLVLLDDNGYFVKEVNRLVIRIEDSIKKN